jgi:hypothetical protein
MWSNDAVADEHPDDESPWTRDDWVPDSAVPDAAVFGGQARRPSGPENPGAPGGRRPADDFDDGEAGSSSSRSSLGRKVVAAAVVAALLVGSAGALLRNDGEPDPDPVPATTSAVDRAPSTTVDTTPITARSATIPPVTGTGDVIEISDQIPSLVVGEPPVWAERTVVVPENLASIASTEVITLSQSGVVNVTEFPSGRTRSVDVSELGAEVQLTVGDGTIVVFDSNTLVQIRDGEPVVESTLTDGIIFVRPWTGTGSFVVTTPSTGPATPERDWVLRRDGTLEVLVNPFADETSFFSRVFSPDGDALFTAPGGVYAVDPDGNARRISTGTLLATGHRHWAIEECDERLRCASSIVEWDTGAVTAGVLDPIERFGFIDPSTHISPDGRSIAFRGDTDGTGRRQILDVATGNTIEAGRINQVVYPDAWATDSSGLFFTDRYLQYVDRATGAITEVDALDRIRTVATAPFSQSFSESFSQ